MSEPRVYLDVDLLVDTWPRPAPPGCSGFDRAQIELARQVLLSGQVAATVKSRLCMN